MICKNDGKIHSGIYTIMCWQNGLVYPGRAKNIINRLKQHLGLLKRNKHHCDHLQNAYNLYGENSLFTIICEENVPHEQLKSTEKIYLDFGKQYREWYFNSSFSEEGVEMTEIIKRKISIKHIGMKASEKTKQKMSKNNCKFWLNKKLSSEVCQKMKNNHANFKDSKNPMFGKISANRDLKIYNFKNIITNEEFIGTRYDFYNKYDLNKCCVNEIINKTQKSTKNWILITTAKSTSATTTTI